MIADGEQFFPRPRVRVFLRDEPHVVVFHVIGIGPKNPHAFLHLQCEDLYKSFVPGEKFFDIKPVFRVRLINYGRAKKDHSLSFSP